MSSEEPAAPDESEPDPERGSDTDDRPDPGGAGDRGSARRPAAWPIPPGLSAALDGLTSQWRANLAAALPSVSRRLSPVPADWAARFDSAFKFTYPVVPSLPSSFDAISQAWRAQISEALAPLEMFRPLLKTFERLREMLPPNWRDPALDSPRLTAVMELANAATRSAGYRVPRS